MSFTRINAFESGQARYVCLSDDDKPVTGMHNGDICHEMDTGVDYYFNADATEWVTPTTETPAESTPAEETVEEGD